MLRATRERFRSDPSLQAIAVSVGGIIIGFVALVIAWVGASRQLFTTLEMSWLASGAIGGLAIIGTSATLLAIHLRRRSLAGEVVLLEQATTLAHQIGNSR